MPLRPPLKSSNKTSRGHLLAGPHSNYNPCPSTHPKGPIVYTKECKTVQKWLGGSQASHYDWYSQMNKLILLVVLLLLSLCLTSGSDPLTVFNHITHHFNHIVEHSFKMMKPISKSVKGGGKKCTFFLNSCHYCKLPLLLLRVVKGLKNEIKLVAFSQM